MSDFARIIIPDCHGNHVDKRAWAAMMKDVKAVKPREVVILGDFLDCGAFKRHPSTYARELSEDCYEDDVDAGNRMLDEIQKLVDGPIHYIEGNHEMFVERWIVDHVTNQRDVHAFVERFSPRARLDLKKRGISYYRRDRHYNGISVQGTIKLGKCMFTHGINCAKFATYQHLLRFGCNVVHGHTHRHQQFGERTVTSEAMVSYCPGTLCTPQPLYMHTNPTSWTHGYGLQYVSGRTGLFHLQHVPIVRGASMLQSFLSAVT